MSGLKRAVTLGQNMSNSEAKDITLEDLLEGFPDIEDETSSEPQIHRRFTITSYGADYPVETLVNRVNRADFYIPEFQRSYVWTLPQASRFVESLLLGLPIPSLFLFREGDTNKHLIIDGQQRLKTLQFFKNGTFRDRTFRLMDVSEPWVGKSYPELSEEDQRRFDDALIHSIIFRQDAPEADNSSIYEVFERLNTGGIKLSPQEIRVCVSHGEFVALLAGLDENADWRAIFGPPSARGKGQELILRFLALLHEGGSYARPMKKFLDEFLHRNRSLPGQTRETFTLDFERTISVVHKALGPRAFRPDRTLNAAVFDAVMVGLCEALASKPDLAAGKIKSAYDNLLQSARFIASYSASTADEDQVRVRLEEARKAFGVT